MEERKKVGEERKERGTIEKEEKQRERRKKQKMVDGAGRVCKGCVVQLFILKMKKLAR